MQHYRNYYLCENRKPNAYCRLQQGSSIYLRPSPLARARGYWVARFGMSDAVKLRCEGAEEAGANREGGDFGVPRIEPSS